MQNALARLGHALFLLAVAGLLAWGGLQTRAAEAALAGTATAVDHCPPSAYIVGHCASQPECDDMCDNVYGPDSEGNCDANGCCWCLLP